MPAITPEFVDSSDEEETLHQSEQTNEVSGSVLENEPAPLSEPDEQPVIKKKRGRKPKGPKGAFTYSWVIVPYLT